MKNLNNSEIFYNGYVSTDLKVYFKEKPSLERLNEEYDVENIEGVNGSLYINKGTYKDRTLPFKVMFISDGDIYKEFEFVEKWLMESKDNRLFYGSNDKVYIVKKVILDNFQLEYEPVGNFSVDFICKPFRQSVEKLSYQYTKTPSFFYQGDFEAEPILTIVGSGNIQVSFNGESFTVNNVVTSVTINTELMTCKLADGTNAKWSGNFPRIEKGQNTVAIVSGTVTEITTEFYGLYR